MLHEIKDIGKHERILTLPSYTNRNMWWNVLQISVPKMMGTINYNQRV